MKKNILSKIFLIVLTAFSLLSCGPKANEHIKAYLDGEFVAEKLKDNFDLVIYDGEKYVEVKYVSHSDKVVVNSTGYLDVIPSLEATEEAVTVKIWDRFEKEYVAEKEVLIKINPARYYAADIISRGWKNISDDTIGYYHSESGKYGMNVTAGTTIDVKFNFNTMILDMRYSSYSHNSSTNETNGTLWELSYSSIEHKLYDKEGNYLYTDKVNVGVEAPAGTNKFLTHIDAIDKYFKYIGANEYVSGLTSTKVEDLLG